MRGDRRAETVVLAVGNPLMGDDGLGPVVLDALRTGWTFDPPVGLLDGGTSALGWLDDLQGVVRLLVLDAVDVGAAPGSAVELEPVDLTRRVPTPISVHAVGLNEALGLAKLTGCLPQTVLVMGLQPETIALRPTLSPAVGDAVAGLVHRVIAQLRGWGHVARPTPTGGERLCTS